MALGGGTFITQNKKLPGSYINFISAARASASLSERGTVALALNLDWGPDEEIFEITNENFIKDSLKIFGYNYSDEKLKGLRDLFLNATKLYAYKLNKGVKADNDLATAKYSGIRGNSIKIVVEKNVDNEEKFDVTTVFDTKEVDIQTVAKATELKDNDYVTFKTSATLEETAGMPLANGTNGETTGEKHQDFLTKLESYNFNAVGCLSEESTVCALYAAFVKRMRDSVGMKCQAVLYNTTSDYEGVVNLASKTKEDNLGLIYWVTGIIGSCAINASNTNRIYNGEYEVNANYTQSELEDAIDKGQFVLHKVGDDIRVLVDINSLISTTAEKNDDFKNNQVIRVLDQYATDVAILFNTKYIGKIQNNEAGRVSFWNDIITLCKTYQEMQAITDFVSDDIIVKQGDAKVSVQADSNLKPVTAMEKLYNAVMVA